MSTEVEVRRWLKGIRRKDEILLAFHNDGDGICSAALMKLFIERYAGASVVLLSQPMPVRKSLSSYVRTTMANKVIFLDLGMDQHPNVVKKIEKDCEVLVIDHHDPLRDLTDEHVLHFNPKLEREVYLPTSYLVYELCNPIVNMSDKLWIAIVGIVSDYQVQDLREFLLDCKKVYPEIEPSQPAIFNTRFGLASEILGYAKAYRMRCEDLVEMLCSSSTLQEFLSNEVLRNAFERVKSEIDAILTQAKSTPPISNRILLFELKTKFALRSIIATKLSIELPRLVVLVYERSGGRVKLSARTQRDTNLLEFFKREFREIEFKSLGGHRNACGLEMDEEDFAEFVERLRAKANLL